MLALLTLPRGRPVEEEMRLVREDDPDAFGIVIRPAPAASPGLVLAREPAPRLHVSLG
jgi:hypothetical protein